jgi:hypothetical protein
MNSGWFAALFWVGFLASIAFRRYHWVDTVWLLAMLVFMIAMSAYRIFHFYRNPISTEILRNRSPRFARYHVGYLAPMTSPVK